MPLATDLSVSPYSDDYDPSKNFSKILFKPGPAVQTRELNQLQTLLQSQIERFGDNILRRGTIVDGCQFTFYEDYPYVKLLDADSTGEAINVGNYGGLFLTDELTGVTARINDTKSGFESTAPDLNTLYVSYIKSGSLGELSFSPDSQLLVTDLERSISSIDVMNNVAGFSNTDQVVIMSSVLVQNSVGGSVLANGTPLADSFIPGGVISQNLTSSTAKAVIVSVSSNHSPGSLLLNIRPLANSLVGAAFSNGQFITENTFQANTTVPIQIGGAEAYITEVIGKNAIAKVNTTSSGRLVSGLSSLIIQDGGEGYTVRPSVYVASGTANVAQIELLQAFPRNFVSRVTVANNEVGSIGSGYAFAVSDGVIYQKGYFSKVDRQSIIVEKYNTKPDNLSIGFDTTEAIVNSNTDYTLLDNGNTKNATAPGADRLVLTPQLIVLGKSEARANTDFFSIVEFASGVPYKQIRDTQYNAIEDAMAKRTSESAGDYILDQFFVSSVSEANALSDSETFRVSVDPGAGYIAGRRVQTMNNYVISVDKGTDTVLSKNINIDVDFGNYITVNQLGGTFPTARLVPIDLYDTPRAYTTTSVGTVPTPATGNKIGTARIRGLTIDGGSMGEATATYKMYLFDVVMNPGKGFSEVKSVFFNGGIFKGVADVFGTSIIKETSNSSLVFSTKSVAVKTLTSANLEFTVRSIQNNVAANGLSTGTTVSVAAGPNAYFPYAGTLTDNELRDIIITPNSNLVSNSTISGTVAGASGSNTLTGTGTSFSDELYPGAYVFVNGNTHKVSGITNNTSMTLAANLPGAVSANTLRIALPANNPIPLAMIPGADATVQANTTLNIGLGFVTTDPAFSVNITYNKTKFQTADTATKSTKRKAYVKLDLSTSAMGTVGPWCLGLPDIFRLRNVYRNNGSYPDLTSENITDSFYIDNNQNENYLDLGYLVQLPSSTAKLAADDFLLVEFDVFQNSADRPFTIDSYNIDDTVEYAVANTAINTAEIPQFYSIQGNYIDLRDQIDFRPVVESTANVLATIATATINPAETRVINQTLDKNIPAPQSDIKFSVESYVGRADRVVMTANGDIDVLRGYPSKTYNPVASPKGSVTLDILNIPPYPTVANELNENITALYDTKIGSEKILTDRKNRFTVKTSAAYNIASAQPKRYSMSQIASLDRRISNVEKMVSLTMVEQQLSDLVIPSSLDSDEVRFKFGFAVDNFEGLLLSDTENPQFNATIFNGLLTPKKKELRVSYVEETGTKVITLPQGSDVVVISQLSATDGPVELPEPPVVVRPEPPIPAEPVAPPPPPPPPPPPVPPEPERIVSLVTEGDVAHICGLVPGTLVEITVYHPKTQNIYMKTYLTVSPQGCVEAPIIKQPDPPVPPVIINPPVTVPPVVVVPDPPVIVVTPTPPPPVVPPVIPPPPPPPVIVVPVPPVYDPPPVLGGGGGGGGGSSGGSYDSGGGRDTWYDWGRPGNSAMREILIPSVSSITIY